MMKLLTFTIILSFILLMTGNTNAGFKPKPQKIPPQSTTAISVGVVSSFSPAPNHHGVTQRGVNAHLNVYPAGRLEDYRVGQNIVKRRSGANSEDSIVGKMSFDCFPLPHGAEIKAFTVIGRVDDSCGTCASITVAPRVSNMNLEELVFGYPVIMLENDTLYTTLNGNSPVFVEIVPFYAGEIQVASASFLEPYTMNLSMGHCLGAQAVLSIDASCPQSCLGRGLELTQVTIWYLDGLE